MTFVLCCADKANAAVCVAICCFSSREDVKKISLVFEFVL